MSASPYQETQGQSRHGQARGFITDVALSVVEPGVNSSVLVFINAVFVLLLITLILILVFLTGFNMHVIIMCLLAVGVLIGINWFIAQSLMTETNGQQKINAIGDVTSNTSQQEEEEKKEK